MSSRSEYATVLAILAAAALVGYLAAGAAWATAWLEDLARTAESATGRDLFPAAGVIPLLALGGLVGIVATRGLARTIVGGFLVAAGALSAIWIIGSDALTEWRNEPVRAAGITETHAWPIAATMLAAAAVVAVGVWTMLHGSRWPTMGSRYERAARTDGRTGSSPTTPQATWDAIDRGDDPTV